MSFWDSVFRWAAGKPGARRSPQWPKLRASHLSLYRECLACGSRKNLEVHHVVPFHVNPQLELDPLNLVTLCEGAGCNCHLTFGHFGLWRSWNLDVIADSLAWREKMRSRP